MQLKGSQEGLSSEFICNKLTSVVSGWFVTFSVLFSMFEVFLIGFLDV